MISVCLIGVKFVFLIIKIIEALFGIQQAYAGALFIHRIEDCVRAEEGNFISCRLDLYIDHRLFMITGTEFKCILDKCHQYHWRYNAFAEISLACKFDSCFIA
jgi:hypothetical protein